MKNLPQGRYEVKADDRPLGAFTDDQLAEGVNLASATADGWEPGGPWDAQAWILTDLTEARSQIALSRRFLDHYLPNQPGARGCTLGSRSSTSGSKACNGRC